jgi:hypothetical protein
MSGRRGLEALMLGSFAVGVVLMIGFHSTLTRVIGMTALITFMVSGLFVLIAPDLLEPGDDDPPVGSRSA